jgi:hypothetical protein
MSLPQSLSLYRADNGALLGKIDLGDGLRAKSWNESLPQILLEAATARGLTNDGYGVLANFPFDGSKTRSRPIGEALSAAPYTSIQLFKCVPQTQSLGLGDATVTAFGDVALTTPDRAHANYWSTACDPDSPVEPRGAMAAPFLQTISDVGANFALAATTTWSIDLNGVRYTPTAAQLVQLAANQTAAQLTIVLQSFCWPMEVVAAASGNEVRIFASGTGATRSIRAFSPANTSGAFVLFTGAGASSQLNVMYYGVGSPLGQMDNTDSAGGQKPQRRIRPGSLSLVMTMAAEVITCTDNRLTGVIAGANIAGTTTVTGTLVYATGAIEFDTAGDQPDNATTITARYDALIPIDLAEEVKMPAGASSLAILVS